MRELEHSRPADIEAESFRIIGAELAERGIVLPADQAPLVKRAIHTTADFDYARNLVFTPGAVEAGVRALRAGTPILTDTNMARSGINRGALERLGISVHCFMADPEVARRAAEAGTTRAAAAVDQGAALWPEGIYAVGNAPTALIRMAQLIRAGAMSPALILAVPVGFVNCPCLTVEATASGCADWWSSGSAPFRRGWRNLRCCRKRSRPESGNLRSA